MAFVRHKTVKGKRYYQLVRNYREEGKHRQEVICHLGVHASLDTAIEVEKRIVADKVARDERAKSAWHERAVDARRNVWRSMGGGILSEQEARLRWQEWWHRAETDPLDEEDEDERLILFWNLEYHEAKKRAEHYEALARSRPAKLNKLLRIRETTTLKNIPAAIVSACPPARPSAQ